jgi:RND family efflux transporter MFP subunit
MHDTVQASTQQAPARSGGGARLAIGVIVLIVLAALGIVLRTRAYASLKRETAELAVPVVAVVTPRAGAAVEEVVVPGTAQAFQDTPIFARTQGYLKRWTVDIGARVHTGQLLAEIDTPEVDQALGQARSQLVTAQADLRISKITDDRWRDMRGTGAVSDQDVDEKDADEQAKQATVAALKSNVGRLADTQSFQKIYAPFDGVITQRNIDVGSLINSGNGGSPMQLFHIADTRTLRVYVDVPEAYAGGVDDGLAAELYFDEFPRRSFEGRVVRSSNALDAASRMLRVEVDIDNSRQELFPGAYAQVHLKIPSTPGAFIVPANSLLFRAQGMQVAAVGDDGHIHLRSVVLGRDFGKEVEVVKGLSGGEHLVINPADSTADGDAVHLSSAAS